MLVKMLGECGLLKVRLVAKGCEVFPFEKNGVRGWPWCEKKHGNLLGPSREAIARQNEVVCVSFSASCKNSRKDQEAKDEEGRRETVGDLGERNGRDARGSDLAQEARDLIFVPGLRGVRSCGKTADHGRQYQEKGDTARPVKLSSGAAGRGDRGALAAPVALLYRGQDARLGEQGRGAREGVSSASGDSV